MKIHAWIAAAAIAAASGFATAPTAQACVIDPAGECLTSVVKSQHKLATHKKQHLTRKSGAVVLLPWRGKAAKKPLLTACTRLELYGSACFD